MVSGFGFSFVASVLASRVVDGAEAPSVASADAGAASIAVAPMAVVTVVVTVEVVVVEVFAVVASSVANSSKMVGFVLRAESASEDFGVGSSVAVLVLIIVEAFVRVVLVVGQMCGIGRDEMTPPLESGNSW